MNQQEQSMINLLGNNRNIIAKAFKVADSVGVSMAAFTWTLAGREATAEQMRASFDYLKSQTSALSTERGTNKLTVASRMAMSGDDAGYLAEVQRIFSRIMEGYKMKTGSRYGTALLIANCTSTPEEADALVDRTKRIFEMMRQAHPVITDDRDMTFAAIVALSDRDDEALLADAEECYQLLGKEYKLTGGRQTMAHVLAISPLPPAEKVARVAELRAAFKANKISIGWTSSQEYATLAMLVLDGRPAGEIAAEIAELNKTIKKLKGFGDFSVDQSIRLLYAAAISTYAHQGNVQTGAVTDAVALALVQALIDWFVYIIIVTTVV